MRAALALLFLTGCSYHFGSLKRSVPGGYDRISVPVFANKTLEAGAQTYFTSAMIEELERGHMAKVVDKSEAQVILEGTVRKIDLVQGAQVTNQTPGFKPLPQNAVLAKEYRLFVEVSLKLKRKSDDKILWAGDFKGEQRYTAPEVTEPVINTVDPIYNQSAKFQTVKLLARDMMAEAHDQMTENF